MKTVKISCPLPGYPISDQNVPLRQTPGGKGVWGEYNFVVNQDIDECDYWVVFDQIHETEMCKCSPYNTIFITGEPEEIVTYPTGFINQFGHVITGHQNIIKNSRVQSKKYAYIQGQSWFVNKTYDELSDIRQLFKPRTLSLITTTKHEKRYKFALDLKNHFGEHLDLFGIGINPIKDKWDAIAPYRYSVVLENFRNYNYISEKLYDTYLAQAFPFYHGCKNIDDYYPKEAYEEIDINYLDYSIDVIERAINDPEHYINAAPYLNRAKDLTLNKYNVFKIITDYIENNKLLADQKKQFVTISDKYRLMKNVSIYLKRKRRGLL
jgi:hypothetical protein